MQARSAAVVPDRVPGADLRRVGQWAPWCIGLESALPGRSRARDPRRQVRRALAGDLRGLRRPRDMPRRRVGQGGGSGRGRGRARRESRHQGRLPAGLRDEHGGAPPRTRDRGDRAALRVRLLVVDAITAIGVYDLPWTSGASTWWSRARRKAFIDAARARVPRGLGARAALHEDRQGAALLLLARQGLEAPPPTRRRGPRRSEPDPGPRRRSRSSSKEGLEATFARTRSSPRHARGDARDRARAARADAPSPACTAVRAEGIDGAALRGLR